jgi:hypothetical protein
MQDLETLMRDLEARARLLVDSQEAARMLTVSRRKLWSMTFEENPGLPYVRCGRLVRYCPEDLRQWVDTQRKGGE